DLLPSLGVHLFWWTPHAKAHSIAEGAGKIALTDTRLKSWLFTIMRNTFCTKFRIAKREAPGNKKCISDVGVAPASQEWTVRAKELQRACNRLPEHYRIVLEYVVIEGRSYEDAATKFGCAIGTVKSRINRARQQLAEQLDEDLY
ncbi:RNA polymerase sigma-70 factor (ECF subfamily), partial [Rhizobium sp. ERR 1071]|uniref:sigma factor-like helix-turn-helix DNA-binding protein n=1 Tax=Rhizobium sp. ERR 1071 TaxID=2572677 RepID=UPI00119BD7FE